MCFHNDGRIRDAHGSSSISRYTAFKAFEKRMLVATDIFGRCIDVERVNIVINYDCPPDADGSAPFLVSNGGVRVGERR